MTLEGVYWTRSPEGEAAESRLKGGRGWRGGSGWDAKGKKECGRKETWWIEKTEKEGGRVGSLRHFARGTRSLSPLAWSRARRR